MNNFENFFVYGFIKGNISKYDIDVNLFDSFEFVDCNNCPNEDEWMDPSAIEILRGIQQKFADTLISPIFAEFEMKDVGMWLGVDEGSARWHNDFEDGDLFNSNVLIYLDNDYENKNMIQIRTNGGDPITLHPQRGDFLWLNQQKCYEHKATHTTGTRRLLSFEYLIPELI